MSETYLELNTSHIRVLSLTGIDENETERGVFIDELLSMSSGTTADAVVHYRVFITSAILLQQDLDQQVISEADKIKFTGLAKPIESLLNLQKAYDTKNALTVAEGFEAQVLLDRLCGCVQSSPDTTYSMSAFVI